MPKRPSSPSRSAASRSAPTTSSAEGPSSQRARTTQESSDASRLPADEDEGMGEFEDAFEDEIEEDDEGEVIYNSDDSDEEGDATDGEGMEVDGVKVDGKIRRAAEDEDEEVEAEPEVYLPGAPLEKDQVLEPDQSAYEMLHRLNVTWPCLSFDTLRDHLGSDRATYPHTAYLVAGTQADTARNNEVMVMKASSMHRTQGDDGLSDDEQDDDDALDDDAVLEYRSIPHLGGVNRVRAAPTSTPTNDLEPCLDPYPVATWSDLGKVHIWDVRPLFNALDRPGSSIDKRKVNTPMYTVEAHRGVEGYAMDWAGTSGGGSSNGRTASSLRLLTGDIHSKIFLTTSNNSGFVTNPTAFSSHTSSVEDLQWSPSETTVFASCSADRSIRVWDVRVKSRKSVISVEGAHQQDVNVISWNRGTDYLLASGGDEGGINVWDLRGFKSGASAAPSPVASFRWHSAPVSSIEWHPTEDSIFAASGRDDQVSLWDLSVELDDEEQPAQSPQGGDREVPPQLLFVHQGQSDVKEVHWHPQIPGALITTALTGFNIFKSISV